MPHTLPANRVLPGGSEPLSKWHSLATRILVQASRVLKVQSVRERNLRSRFQLDSWPHGDGKAKCLLSNSKAGGSGALIWHELTRLCDRVARV